MIYCNIRSGYFELNCILNLDDEIDELLMEKAVECLENQVREMTCALFSIFFFILNMLEFKYLVSKSFQQKQIP